MELDFVNIHTHRPTGRGIELRTAGIHPWRAEEYAVADADELRRMLDGALTQAQAIGETGLDFARDVDRTAQERLFRAHAELSASMRLPLVLHCVRAFEPVMKILGEYDIPGALFHGFIGSREQMRRAVEAGYYLSFGVRSLSSPKTLDAMRATPLARLFLETDDDPAAIESVYRAAAEALGTDIGQLLETTNCNYGKLLGKKR
ncbi:MAG: TatD family hydrolase [Alistipes sp.]|nr:TatD family hydrolase [Alistipes sp.]